MTDIVQTLRCLAGPVPSRPSGYVSDVPCPATTLRAAAYEIEVLREQVRREQEENRWSYIQAALDDTKEAAGDAE